MVTRAVGDPELVAKAVAGDLSAYEALVRLHADAVYAHALRFFGDVQTAEDATQEVFLKVYRSLGSFDGRSRLSTWLYRVTRNVCLDMVRAGKRIPIPVDPISLEPPSVADFASDIVFSDALESALGALAPEERDALSAIGLFGLSYAEAGEALGVPEGTVKSRVFRARRALTHMLHTPEGGEADGLHARR